MKISVIVPVYNVEQYLRECLNSVLAQTYQPLEIILIDDGSTDRSGSICDEYASKYNNIKVIHKENAGLGLARNTGLEHVTGEYVTFLDSDDYLDPECIENLYKELKKHKVDVCKGGFRRVTDQKEVLFTVAYKDELYEGEKARLELLPRMIGSRPDKKDSIEMCVCGVLYKTAPIKEHGLQFPSERVLISEDLIFNIDYMQYANGAYTTERVGYNYRMNPNSLSTSFREDRLQACCYFVKEVTKKLKDLGYDHMAILRLHRIFFVYLRVCIQQETKKVSGLCYKENIRRIRELCDKKMVRKIIHKYPDKQLGWRQRIFLKLIEYRCANILYFVATWRLL